MLLLTKLKQEMGSWLKYIYLFSYKFLRNPKQVLQTHTFPLKRLKTQSTNAVEVLDMKKDSKKTYFLSPRRQLQAIAGNTSRVTSHIGEVKHDVHGKRQK